MPPESCMYILQSVLKLKLKRFILSGKEKTDNKLPDAGAFLDKFLRPVTCHIIWMIFVFSKNYLSAR